MSGLDQIREDAGITRERLLTEEEKESVACVMQEASAVMPQADNRGAGKVPYIRLLEKLLAGEDNSSIAAWLQERFLMPSVVVDAVNEALFDEIGDTVLDYDGAVITIVEDYREELTERLLDLSGSQE